MNLANNIKVHTMKALEKISKLAVFRKLAIFVSKESCNL
jgi:hypothetical protein